MTPHRLIFVIALLCLARGPINAAEPSSNSGGVLSHIPREPVDSTGIAALGYSHRRQILEIKFKSGNIYRYVGVPKSVYHDMLKADSKTAFYTFNIRGNYRAFYVRPRIKEQAETH